MAEVFLCKKGQLSPTSRKDLREAGIIVVEVADPATCQFIRSSEVVNGSDMLWAVLDALNYKGNGYGDDGKVQREKLAANLFQIVVEARKPNV